MTTPDVRPMTVRWVLDGGADRDDAPLVPETAATAFARSIDGVADRLSGVVGREFAAVATTLADLDLADVLLAGWRTEKELVSAAMATLERPGSEQLVDLATHRVESIHRPAVDVTLDGAVVATVDFEITVAVVLRAVVATVRDGRLAALDGGRCTASAVMKVEGQQIAEGTREFDVPALTVSLGRGLPLVGDDRQRDTVA